MVAHTPGAIELSSVEDTLLCALVPTLHLPFPAAKGKFVRPGEGMSPDSACFCFCRLLAVLL